MRKSTLLFTALCSLYGWTLFARGQDAPLANRLPKERLFDVATCWPQQTLGPRFRISDGCAAEMVTDFPDTTKANEPTGALKMRIRVVGLDEERVRIDAWVEKTELVTVGADAQEERGRNARILKTARLGETVLLILEKGDPASQVKFVVTEVRETARGRN